MAIKESEDRPQESVNHSEFIAMVRAGHAFLDVDPAFARRVLTDSDSEALRALIGESLGIERTAVKLVFGSSWIFPLASIGFAIKVFGWWSALVIPVCFGIWCLYAGRASMGGQRLWPTFSFLSLSIVFCLTPHSFLPFQVWLALVAAGFFFINLTYFMSCRIIRSLVLRNSRAFSLFERRGVQVITSESGIVA